MTVSATDFLVSAKDSCNAGDEMSYRNCVSRAYYSVFHAAKPIGEAHCPDPNANFVGIAEHLRLSKRFLASGIKGAKSIGYALENMKRARHRADYHLDEDVGAADATQQLADAKVFTQYLTTFEQAVKGASGAQQSSGSSAQSGGTP